ncbi:5'-deoxyadenosine deaminase [uncultured archaeon]|nr:5'-deoxyadenosine deaminase [uncultured archaeon]
MRCTTGLPVLSSRGVQYLKTSAVGRLATSARLLIQGLGDLKPDDHHALDNLNIPPVDLNLMLIKNVSILQSSALLPGRDILIENGKIAKIGRDLQDENDDEVIDGRGKLAIPGLVNCHTHLAMTLLRGYADDMELMPWLREKIWPLEARLTEEDIRWGVKLGCLEHIRFGITCFNDMYYFPDAAAAATKEMGLRAFMAGVVFDMKPEFLSQAEPFIRRWKGDDLIVPTLGPHAAYTCSEETLQKVKEVADRNDTMIHIHLSETREEVDGFLLTKGKSPVEYLDSLGLLNERLAAVHCVWLSEEDCYLLAEKKANVVDCTVSNLKLTSGIAPLNTLMKAQVNVCLGTDGASSNNNLSLFEEMKVTAIVQKNAYHTPEAFSAEQIWRVATENAYRAFGLNMGMHEGALADLALIDLQRPWFYPQTNIISHLVYSMTGGVDTTIVNGKVLMREGFIPGEAEILEEAQKRFLHLTS